MDNDDVDDDDDDDDDDDEEEDDDDEDDANLFHLRWLYQLMSSSSSLKLNFLLK